MHPKSRKDFIGDIFVTLGYVLFFCVYESPRTLGKSTRRGLESVIRFVLQLSVLFMSYVTPHKSIAGSKDHRPAIIMQFTVPPSLDDILDMARAHLENLPEELLEKCHDLSVSVDDFPDTATEQDAGATDPYELLAVFKGGAQIAPGVTLKVSRGADILYLYRRPILDLWADEGDDLNNLIRQIMIGELGESLDFSEGDIDEMITRHYQGLFF